MKWAVMQEILKLLHRIAQFMNWALRVSCYYPFHELGNSAAQFMNWTILQIGRNIYTDDRNRPIPCWRLADNQSVRSSAPVDSRLL